MNRTFFFYFFIPGLLLALSMYNMMAMRSAFPKSKLLVTVAFAVLTVIAIWGYFQMGRTFASGIRNMSLTKNLITGTVFSIFVFQLFLAPIFLLEDVWRVGEWITGLFSSRQDNHMPSRRNFIASAGLVVAGIPFASMLHGITRGKYLYKLRSVSLTFDDLPDAFDGMKIVQISDIHSGSFDSKENVERGVKMMMEQEPDLIVFTGDLVNNYSDEILPYIPIFKKLEAKYGIFSILGNHDYGDYADWPDKQSKRKNLENLYQYHEQMGFRLLRNETVEIESGSDKIRLMGVENWGLPPFPQHGDLEAVLKESDKDSFNILLSHDPSHWDAQVVGHKQKVHLTMSGHTHGMQFGIEIPGWKWSPVKYKYPRWAGLYKKAEQFLYVNRGFGFLAFPGRVGIWPEVTLLELRKS